MRKFIAIALVSLFAVSCAGSQRGCGCPNNLGMVPMKHQMDLPQADYTSLETEAVWN